MCVCVCVCVFVCVCVCRNIDIYVHTYTHTNINSLSHTHTLKSKLYFTPPAAASKHVSAKTHAHALHVSSSSSDTHVSSSEYDTQLPRSTLAPRLTRMRCSRTPGCSLGIRHTALYECVLYMCVLSLYICVFSTVCVFSLYTYACSLLLLPWHRTHHTKYMCSLYVCSRCTFVGSS